MRGGGRRARVLANLPCSFGEREKGGRWARVLTNPPRSFGEREGGWEAGTGLNRGLLVGPCACRWGNC